MAAAGSTAPKDIDGVNLIPYLKGDDATPPHDALFWRFGPQKAVRKGQWKVVDWRDFDTKQNSGWQLYDLSKDIGERENLVDKNPQIVAELSRAWDDWNAKNIPPQWRGGVTEDPTSHFPNAKPAN
jgi:arylsulfatase A-like enzyme